MHLTKFILICIFLKAALAKFLNVSQKNCLEEGVRCAEDCSAVVFCAEGGQEIVIDDCGLKNENCATFDDQVRCSNTQSDCPFDQSFLCVQSGSFPDPFDCSVSYSCQSDNPNPVMKCECASHEYWDTTYGQCSQSPSNYDDCCISPESKPKCNETHYDGTFGSCHPGYYYICSLQPEGRFQVFVLRCNAEEIYNPTLHRCEYVRNIDDSRKIKKKRDVGSKEDARCRLVTTTSTTEVTKTTRCIEVTVWKTTTPWGTTSPWETTTPPWETTTPPWETTTPPWETTTPPWETTTPPWETTTPPWETTTPPWETTTPPWETTTPPWETTTRPTETTTPTWETTTICF